MFLRSPDKTWKECFYPNHILTKQLITGDLYEMRGKEQFLFRMWIAEIRTSGEHRSSHHLGFICTTTLSQKNCCYFQWAVLPLSPLSPGSQWASSACWCSGAWAQVFSDQWVEPLNRWAVPLLVLSIGAEAAWWRVDEVEGSLKCFFFFSTGVRDLH